MSFHAGISIAEIGIGILVAILILMVQRYLTRLERIASSNTEKIDDVSDRLTLFILAVTEADVKISAKWQDLLRRVGANPNKFNLKMLLDQIVRRMQ